MKRNFTIQEMKEAYRMGRMQEAEWRFTQWINFLEDKRGQNRP